MVIIRSATRGCRMTTATRTLSGGLVALVASVALMPTGAVGASPSAAGRVPVETVVCVPPPYVWLETSHGTFRMTATAINCYRVGSETGRVLGPASQQILPSSRFALRQGELV